MILIDHVFSKKKGGFMVVGVLLYTVFLLVPHKLLGEQIQCKEAVFEQVIEKEDNVFEFVAHLHCNTGNLKAIEQLQAEAYNYFLNHNSYTIFSSKFNVPYEGLLGQKLEVLEKISGNNGKLEVYSDIYLVDNQTDRFLLDSLSTKIEAEGDAKVTKYNGLRIEVNTKLPSSSIVFTKHALVKKPWIVPRAYFIRRVKSGIASSFQIIKDEYEPVLTR